MRERGFATIMMLFTLLLIVVIGIVLVSLQVTALEAATGALQTTRAFYVAEGALQYVIQHEFNGDADWSDNVSPTASYNGFYSQAPHLALGAGRAWVRYLNQTADSVDFEVTARVGTAVRVLRQQAAAVDPAAFRYVQFASNNIDMNNSDGTINGDVASGGTASVSEVTVNGTVTSGSTAQLPTVDWAFYEAHADQVVNGNLDFPSGTYGDAVNGYLWYVKGNVTINGNTTIHGTIVTEGNLIAQNPKTNYIFQAVPKNLDADPEPETMPALLIQGSWDFSNVTTNLGVTGLVYVLGNINLSNADQLVVSGALLTDGSIHVNNTDVINLTYDAAYLDGLLGFSNQDAPAVAVSGWEEVP